MRYKCGRISYFIDMILKIEGGYVYVIVSVMGWQRGALHLITSLPFFFSVWMHK